MKRLTPNSWNIQRQPTRSVALAALMSLPMPFFSWRATKRPLSLALRCQSTAVATPCVRDNWIKPLPCCSTRTSLIVSRWTKINQRNSLCLLYFDAFNKIREECFWNFLTFYSRESQEYFVAFNFENFENNFFSAFLQNWYRKWCCKDFGMRVSIEYEHFFFQGELSSQRVHHGPDIFSKA